MKAHFGENPLASVKQAKSEIEALTGLERSANRVRLFLETLGLKRRKIGMIPAKADVEQPEVFKKNAGSST